MSSKNSKQLAAKWKSQFQSDTFWDAPGHCQLGLLLAELGACSDVLRPQWAQDPQGWGGLLRQHPQSPVGKPRKGEKLPNPVKWTYWAQYVTPMKQLWRCTHRKGRSSAEDLKCRHYFWTVVFGFSFPKVTNGWSLGKGGGRKVKKKLQRNQCWTLGNVICSWCWRSTYKMMQVRRNKLLPSLFPEKLFSNCSRGTLSSCAVRNNMHMLILMQEGTALLLLF